MTPDTGIMKPMSGKYMDNEKPIYLCKDCIHCSATIWNRLTQNVDKFFCNAASNDRLDLVTGKVLVSEPVTCRSVRSERFSGDKSACGPLGKQWKPKNKKDLFRLIVKASNE